MGIEKRKEQKMKKRKDAIGMNLNEGYNEKRIGMKTGEL